MDKFLCRLYPVYPEKNDEYKLVWSDNIEFEQKNVDLTLQEKLKNQHIIINMDPVACKRNR